MNMLLRHPDRPVRLLFPLPPRQPIRIERRNPARLPGPPRAIQDRQQAVRIIHDRNLPSSSASAPRTPKKRRTCSSVNPIHLSVAPFPNGILPCCTTSNVSVSNNAYSNPPPPAAQTTIAQSLPAAALTTSSPKFHTYFCSPAPSCRGPTSSPLSPTFHPHTTPRLPSQLHATSADLRIPTTNTNAAVVRGIRSCCCSRARAV